MINKYYFINKFETNNIDKLDKKTTVIYRNYKSKNLDENLILKIKKFCKKRKIKFYLSNNIKIAIKLDLDGVYLPAFNQRNIYSKNNYKKKFTIIGSAHSIKEIKIKEQQGVKLIFLSPLFKS